MFGFETVTDLKGLLGFLTLFVYFIELNQIFFDKFLQI